MARILLVYSGQATLPALEAVAALPWPGGAECLLLATPRRRTEVAAAHEGLLHGLERLRAVVGEDGEVESSLREGPPAQLIQTAARELDADLIALDAADGGAAGPYLLGPIARAVAQQAERPVLALRAPLEQFDRVLLATDGTPPALRARDWLIAAPFPVGAETFVVAVAPPPLDFVWPTQGEPLQETWYLPTFGSENRALAHQLVEQEAAVIAASGREARAEARQGSTTFQIVHAARQHQINLVAMGARGLTGLAGALGSTSLHVLEYAPCSVLVVH